MSVSREQIERALEAAKQDNNQSAVSELEGMLGDPQGALDTSVNYSPGEVTERVGALDLQPEPGPVEQTSALQPEAKPPKPILDDRGRSIAQEQYDADQKLITSGAATPTPEQMNDFMGIKVGNIPTSSIKDSLGRQIVVDQKTGKARWSAMSPDQMEKSLRRKDRPSTTKATVGALAYGSTRFAGATLSNIEGEIDRVNAFQSFLLTADDGLPKSERQRIMNLARQKYGSDSDYAKNPGTIPANQVREWIDMNPENNKEFDRISGDEWWEERKETGSRLLNKIGSGWSPGAAELNIFGADDPTGALTGRESYEGIDYVGKYPPAYAGASVDLRDWKSSSKKSPGVYEHVVRPLLTGKMGGETPGQRLVKAADDIRKDFYGEEQEAERQMPIFSPDVKVKNFRDLFNPDLYTDPNSKLMNPESLFLMFMENAPELGFSFAVTRSAGGVAARRTAKDMYGQTVSTMNKAREAAAGRAGMIAGGGTEGLLVQGHVEQETRQILDQVPMETWRENPMFQQMTEAGMTEEDAKQIMMQEAASKAGVTAGVITMATGAPMNRFMGRSAAGRLVQDRPGLRRGVGLVGEPVTEGAQEVMEMIQTELAVRPIDPDNPIYDDPNRYLEAFSAGAIISLPFGGMAALEPSQPAGIEKADVDAVRSTAKYMEITNERFKLEAKMSDPEHIANTTPNQRLKELHQLEKLQVAEADAILKAAPKMRDFLNKQGTVTAQTELKMLNRLVMRANAMKTDIAVAKSKRTTATELQRAEREVMRDRAELQQKVNEQVIKLEDINSMTSAIESIQNLEAISPEQEQELVKAGYAKRTKDGKLVVLPKGKRATKELNRQARGLQDRLDKGFTGEERRQTGNLVKRDLVDSAGPVEREQMLYQDNLTGAQNRRAFNERQENIDVREGQEKATVEGAAPAIAAVDVDSLAWVNDNMSHSAGDRLLVAVSDALGKQAGVEVFRLGGDEFAVTAASQEELETSMQTAATELAETEIIAGEDVVTPQITWGKGENYEQADAESLTMKKDRQSRGIVADRKKKAATYKHRAQKALFQRDSEAGLPRHWYNVSGMVERGDSAEILTPDGAVQGVVTKMTNRNGRPRMTVNVQGREFLFNPRNNHLIVSPMMDPADLAWITGDAEYAQPDRVTFPQTLVDINIGHLSKDGIPYADLGEDFEYEAPAPWWLDAYPDLNWHPRIPYMPVERVASEEQLAVAEAVKAAISDGRGNMPDVHIVESLDWLKKEFPEVLKQIRDEMGLGGNGSINAVRGYMDHINPENGVFVFPANISAIVGKANLEQGIQETIYHEVIGHYGVRGMFGYEAELRPFMHELVDAFPRLADFHASTLGLNKANPAEKQLLGEEMVAYIAGQVKSGQITFNKKQEGLWARFVAWIKELMTRRNYDRFSPVKKMVSLHDTKENFWNSDKVQTLLARSNDFVRHGNGFKWTPLEDTTKPFIRDGNIFQAGFITAMKTATFKPNNREKGELAKRYGGKTNVPDEVALFPDDATPNAWKQLITKAQKDKWMTQRELDLSGLSEKSNFYLFRDGTYGTLDRYMRQLHNNNPPYRWYQGILPADVTKELDDINDAMEKNHIAGPLKITGYDGDFDDAGNRIYHYEDRPILNKVSADLMRERIAEIMTQKMNPKKTRLTKELMMAHMLSENAYRIFVEKQGGHPGITRGRATKTLFGDLSVEEINNLTDLQKQQIKAEVLRTSQKGYNIGYNKDLDRWLDFAAHTTEYSEWSPQGSRFNDDFRVMLIKSEGADGKMGYTGHYDSNIMHIRTGVAELLDTEGMPELEFPNPEMQGKMLSLIELQSDWLQKLRKGFSSHDEKNAAAQEYKVKRDLLNMVGDNLGRGIAEDLWNAANAALKPILNLPDGATNVPGGTLFPILRERAIETTGDVWEDLTPDQKKMEWKSLITIELDKVRDMFSDAHDGVHEFRDSLPPIDDLVGNLDARGFEYLDNIAVRRLANTIMRDLNSMIDSIQGKLRYANTQAELVSLTKDMQSKMGNNLNTIASRSDYGEGMRLPMTEYKLTPMLGILYGRSGADKNRIAELMSALKTREMATVRVPIDTLRDANTAMMTVYDPQALMSEIIAGSRVSKYSDMIPGALNLQAVTAGEGFIDVKIVGNKADVTKAKDLIPKLIETWFDNHAAEKRRIAIETRNQPDRGEGAQGDYSFSDLEDSFNLTEEDTEGEGTPEMANYDVTSYYSFEENELPEIESDIINEAFNNMSESDWDGLEADYEGVSRQGQDYLDRIVIDEDGDVDNDEAERNLASLRDDYRTEEMYQDEQYREMANEQVREMWDEKGPTALIHGSLPVSWDQDGEPYNYVSLVIKAEDPGDAYDIIIDGDEMDYEHDLSDAKDGLSDQIKEYYQNNEISPPAGAPYGPTADPEPLVGPVLPDPSGPNWSLVKSNVLENMSMMSDESQKMDKVFEKMVTLRKHVDYGQIHEPSPVAKDEQWRPLALKFLISDAVRRGLGGVMWNNGLSSSTRGGMGLSGVTATTRITWSKETIGIRGEEQEVYVIRYPEAANPLVVSRSSMVPALGADVARMVYMQESGKLEIPTMPGTPEEGVEPDARDNYIVATTEGGATAVYRRRDNNFLGFAQNDEQIDSIIENDKQNISSTASQDGLPPTGEPLGDVISKGMIDQDIAGGLIHVISGGRARRYSETFDRPQLAGARQSYEDITVRIWNKELKKYGAHISDTYVKSNNMQKAQTEEGQPSKQSPKRDEQIAEEHGRLYVSELTGEMHGWVVMSDKKGPIVNDVFQDRSYADTRLTQYIRDNYGSDREGVKVMYFPINDKMREEFSGPVAPFHYDPTQDPKLKSAAKKVGYKKKPLKERINNWREGMGAEARQGMVDQFYGLKKALNDAGQNDDAYISARLTTSLDSMMKGVLYYGHPVWDGGIVQNRGKGLLDVFQPIMGDPDTWGLYMAGKRAKGLMLEGYDKLDVGEKKLIDVAAAHFDNDIIAMMSFALEYDPSFERDPGMLKPIKMRKDARQQIVEAEMELADLIDARDKDIYRSRTDSRRIPREWVEGQIKELREKLLGVKQRRSPPSNEWIESVNAHRIFYENQLDPDARIAELETLIKEIEDAHAAKPKELKRWAKRDDSLAALPAIIKLTLEGREHLFEASEIESMIKLGDKFPHFARVAKDYAAFNKKMLDFAEASGIIDAETRPLWENADYVPFYRVDDNRLAGSGMSPTAGIANQRAPIRRLHGADNRIGDIMGNIMMNTTKLIDASVKNNAALDSIDALRGSGLISKKPMEWKAELIPMNQMKKVLIDKGVIVAEGQKGIHLRDIPEDALTGMQKMFALKAPQGDGIVSVMRKGKREYYYTDDMLLYRSLSSINKKHFGQWINLFRAPKRLLTTLITIDPAFMLSNFIRDTGSAFVIGRDKGNLPVLSALKGFGQALIEDEAMRTLVGAGAAFENGYITGGDPRQVKKLLKAAMKKKGFVNSVLDSPKKLGRAWLHIGSSIENSNRMAVYSAAIAAGKSKKQAAYEAKDLMDFSMGGDWPVIQFLIQTVPFMNARAQGIYRLGRGAVEHPAKFTIKGMLVGLAGISLYLAFKDDERYKELEMWDRHAYFHWWIGDAHYRLPKPFEVGAIFNTIPEMFVNYAYDKETDAGKMLMREFGHMVGQTFNMNPIPQTAAPLMEAGANYNFFTGRPIVSYYEGKRLPPDQYRYRTSPTMIELARRLPDGLDTVSGKIRSPLHLQNLYAGYTGTIGRYMLQAADMAVEKMLDYPLPPAWEIQDYPVAGRFVRGEGPARRTKYETEVYRLLNKTTQIQGSLNFHEKLGNVEEYLATHEEHEPYIRAAGDLEGVREDIQEVNRAIMTIHMDEEMDPKLKQKEIDDLETIRNELFKEGWKLRPGGEYNPDVPLNQTQVIDMIDNWGVDNSTAFERHIEENSPDTYELLDMISNSMNSRQLGLLAKAVTKTED